MLRTFIQFAALLLTLIASFFLLKGNLNLSPTQIAELSKTGYGGCSPWVAKSLAAQSVDSRIGFILLLMAFLFQMFNVLWPMRWVDFSISRSGVLVALIFSIVIFGTSLLASRIWHKHMYASAVVILKGNHGP